MNITKMTFLDVRRSEVPQSIVWELVNKHVEYEDKLKREHIFSLALHHTEIVSAELEDFIKQLCEYDEDACYFRLLQE